MIKKIIHIGDLHFKTYKRHEEFKEQFSKLFDHLKELRDEYDFEELRIVIAGDIVDQKITVSNELTMILAWFFREISQYAPVIMIAGNHDFLEHNKDRVDSLTPVIDLIRIQDIYYLKESKCVEDQNIIWCPYSLFQENKRPNIEEFRKKYGEKTTKKFIGLFHGPLIGSFTDLGFEVKGADLSIFADLDWVMCADIHKRQQLEYEGIPIVYCGSYLQLSYGETVTQHGFLIWDVETGTYEEYNVNTDYGFYQFKVNSLEDIETGSEELTNE
jgi:DNA repair exonuclease SbcCD nuclease subunit